MASLKLLLGMIPSTAKIELADKALKAEFDKLNAFAESPTLKRFTELKDLINSSDFLHKRKEIESLRYKNSEEYAREKEFLSLQKAKDIVLYFRTIAGSTLKRFRELDGSDKIHNFESLEKLVKSLEFREKMKTKEFKGSSDYNKLQEFNRFKGSTEIKEYFSFKNFKKFVKAIRHLYL